METFLVPLDTVQTSILPDLRKIICICTKLVVFHSLSLEDLAGRKKNSCQMQDNSSKGGWLWGLVCEAGPKELGRLSKPRLAVSAGCGSLSEGGFGLEQRNTAGEVSGVETCLTGLLLEMGYRDQAAGNNPLLSCGSSVCKASRTFTSFWLVCFLFNLKNDLVFQKLA